MDGSTQPQCKRGVFGLQSWEPLRKPGVVEKIQEKRTKENETNNHAPTNNNHVMNGKDHGSKEKSLIVKYSYTANPKSPIGDELSIKPFDKLVLLSDVNQHWWLARDLNGKVGYVPANYVMIEEQNTGLPWLQSRPAEDSLETQHPMETAFGRPEQTGLKSVGGFKPYQSAYNRKEPKDEKKWHCEICNKTLNGPQPYRAHMASKAHKEEVKYAEESGAL